MNNFFPQTPFRITIKTLQNLEEVLAGEMRELGANNIEIGRRVVHCTGDMALVYKCNLHLRTALRVLIPVVEFPIRQADDIHSQAMKFDWTTLLDLEQTFAIDPNVNSDFIKHSNYASVKLKDAIADTFNRKFGKRPSVDPDRPDVLLHLHVDNHRVSISLDSSGETLNRRGYRTRGARAPLNEVLAAGMIMLTGWRGETDFYDPMCGSGTLAIEANMIARNMPPQILRNEFGFMYWMSFDKELWQSVKRAATEKIKVPTHRIYASDADKFQLRTATENIENAGFEDDIELSLRDFMEMKPAQPEGIIVMNPPYGERMDDENIIPMYKAIGDHLKHACSGLNAWIISSDEAALKRVGLKPSRKIALMNGTLDCKFYRFDLFAGKRNERHNKTTDTPSQTE
jgi:putative N6-adenine-specific DNA methylase